MQRRYRTACKARAAGYCTSPFSAEGMGSDMTVLDAPLQTDARALVGVRRHPVPRASISP